MKPIETESERENCLEVVAIDLYVLRVNVRAEIVSVWFKEGDRATQQVYICE